MEYKEGMGGLKIVLSQHLLRLCLLLGPHERRICCLLKLKAFRNWDNQSSFIPLHQGGVMPYKDKQERKFSFGSTCFDGLL